MTDRALSWLDQQQAEARLVRLSEIPEEERPNFEEILLGEGRNGHQHAHENMLNTLKLKGQHVGR
ncbi:hypothetical protein SEA_BIG4_243 [Microbacterium phage Big4]|nr:hypothetical protein SEA_BIG4_243 [Microbacterium phage Big4]